VPEGVRDPDDKDGRALKDFVAPNMKPVDILAFRNAFAPNGYVWIWGCNFPRVVNQVLKLIEKNPRYSESIGDDQQLEFTALKADEIESFLVLNNFFNLDRQKLVTTRKCWVRFGDIKDALLAGIAGSYPYQLAANTKVRAIGALYGTYAEFFATGKFTNSPKLMAISPKTLSHVEFYKRHFKFKTDSEGRNYGIFEPATP